VAIRVLNRFPGANVRVLALHQAPNAEVVFTADPHGGAEALWFDFRIEDPEPPAPVPELLTLTLRFFGNQPGSGDPVHCRPVIREPGKSWNRLRAPVVTCLEDSQPLLHWTIPYPVARVELAFCHPYGRDELDVMLQRAKGYWREESIGLTQAGRLLPRLDNRTGAKGRGAGAPRGLYLLARQQPGGTPGSWVLDGVLETISRARPANWCVWCAPFTDLDGVIAGDSGSASCRGLIHAWGRQPLRHEAAVLQGDMVRWAAHCRPELVLDLQACGPGENDGIYISAEPVPPEAERSRQAWTNILQQAVGPEFAADPFVRGTESPPQGGEACIADYVRNTFGCGMLTVRTPSTSCRDTLMTPKQYREAGRRLAQAILGRW